MPFRFNMQKVLDYREQREEEAKVRLAMARSRLKETKERLAVLEVELHAAQDRLGESTFTDGDERWLLEVYIKGLNEDAGKARVQVYMQTQLVEEARKLTLACSIDKKILEKLKSRQKQRYVQEEKLKEQHSNDEVATLRYKAPSF